MKNTARLAAAGLLAAMALGATTLPADATVAKTTVQTRTTNPNHVLPTEQAEAWWTYNHEIMDGCWEDFATTYIGMQTADAPKPHTKTGDNDYMVLDSTLHPGFVFLWAPYDDACNLD